MRLTSFVIREIRKPVGVRVKKGEGLEVTVEPLAQIGHDAQAHKAHEVGLAEIEEALDQEKEDDGHWKQNEHLRVLLQKDLVQGGLYQIGLCGRE